MDNRDLDLLPEEFPSPEELFRIDVGDGVKAEEPKEERSRQQEQLKKETTADMTVKTEEEVKEASLKAKPILKYRVVRFFLAGFVILILVIALFITNMDRFHLHCYCMMTDSMEGIIPKGSVVFSYDIPMEELEVGDVITYINSQGVSVTHQIVDEIYDYNESGSRTFYTKGTQNDTVDEDAVTYDMIRGKVFIYIPYIARPFIH